MGQKNKAKIVVLLILQWTIISSRYKKSLNQIRVHLIIKKMGCSSSINNSSQTNNNNNCNLKILVKKTRKMLLIYYSKIVKILPKLYKKRRVEILQLKIV